MNVIITSLEVIKYTGVNCDDSAFREEMSAFREESKESTENFGGSQSEYLIDNKTKTNFTPQHLIPHKKAELKKSITSKNIEDEELNFLSDSESKEDEKPQESVKYTSENNITLLSHDSAQFSQTLMSNISRFNKSERNNLAMIESKITGALLLINSLMNVYFNPEIEDSSVNANLKKEAVFDILFDVILQTGIYAMYSLQDSFFKRNLKTSFCFVSILDKWIDIFVKVTQCCPDPEEYKEYIQKMEKSNCAEFPIMDMFDVKKRVDCKIVCTMLDSQFIGLLCTLLFLGFPKPKLIFISTILRMDKLLFDIKISSCKVLNILLDYIPLDKLDSKIEKEFGKTVRAKCNHDVYNKIKNSQARINKINYKLMNVFPNIINNLISLTRDSKFGVKEAKSLMDVNSFNLLLNSSKMVVC
ncbi:unnamed protein product [Moneuplotes crassus]|uniref:Uncharacterized protein n=1 Tax=Euplotes crassus TaxID=5936 RepID=A0AAD1X6K8_EUPCR|nr:unnamed protein product [Moneuplotes crassus]